MFFTWVFFLLRNFMIKIKKCYNLKYFTMKLNIIFLGSSSFVYNECMKLKWIVWYFLYSALFPWLNQYLMNIFSHYISNNFGTFLPSPTTYSTTMFSHLWFPMIFFSCALACPNHPENCQHLLFMVSVPSSPPQC